MKKRSLVVALAMGLLFTGACSDDDDTSGEAESGDRYGPREDSAAEGDFCDAYMELLAGELPAGEPPPEQIREVAGLAPVDAAGPLEAIAAGFEAEGQAYAESADFGTNFTEIGEVANEACADEVLDVTAVDYAFEGIPTDLLPGTIGVNFTNTGEEFHDIFVFRKNDGVTQSFEEIFEEMFALGEDEAGELVTSIGRGFAGPGESSASLFDLSEAGDYAAVCFVPVGATPDADTSGDGPRHFTQGMFSEFTVS